MKEFDFEKTPIVEIANEILLDGVKRGASDIHFDPYKDGLAVRMRVDGVLYDYAQVPADYKRNMVSRIKMIASMNIMETRLPQDGAIKSKIGDKTLDLRVSSLPTHNGEKVVLRILDYSKSMQGLETLGFSEHNLQKIIDMIEIPNGIVLVTGATGSGKSTTVYSILQKLNTREVNIITVEDPVEMEVEGLNQVQAQQEIGLDFATVLRSILRQDPDIIMIGEIRDSETAKIAVRASITGHKVLSTIHTNNALNTIERLTDMDVERYLIGTSLNGIISQKLARKLCPHCRIVRETNDYEKSLFKTVLHKDVDKVHDVNPEGCENCFKGYRNRIAIAEVLVITDAIRSAITTSQPKEVMRKLVYYDGHTHTLLEDGLEKIELGETNFDEIFKLVDLENDLAVAKSIYEEVEKDMGHEVKNEEEKPDENNIAMNNYKDNTNNTIIEIGDSENNQTVDSSHLETTNVENETVPNTTQEQPTLVNKVPETKPIETVKIIDENPKQEEPAIQNVEVNDTSTTNQPIDNNAPIETLEVIDENPKQEQTSTQNVVVNKTFTTNQPVENNAPIETLDIKEEPEIETLNTQNNQTLTNPIKNEEIPLETFDTNINYDQMVKVPFVDETLDL